MQAEASHRTARLANGNKLRSIRNTPLKVALLGYRSNPYSGGQGVYLKYLSRALTRLGHEVDVISGEPYPELDSNVTLIKVPGLNLFAADNHVTALRWHHLTSYADSVEWLSMLTGGFAEPYTFGLRLRKLLHARLSRYDVIHDNQSLCYELLKIERRGIPLITTIHHPITSDRDIALNNAKNWGERLLIRRWHSFLNMQVRVASRLRHIVTVSNSSKKDIAASFRIPADRISVVPNGIDRDDFHPLPGVSRNPHQIISTASADQPLKGTACLIQAFAQIREHISDAQLVLIGQPKPGGANDRLIDQLNLRHAISFRHHISTAEICSLYARSSLALVPSEYEGFGLPAGEAMACGVPVVSTRGGALPEVVGDAGILVPVRDPQAMARAALEVLGNNELHTTLARKGLNRIKQEFCWDRVALDMTQLYKALLRESAAA